MQKDEMKKVIFVQKVTILHPNDKNRILVLKRHAKDISRPSDWDIPGGRARFNETHEEALSREIREETGLDVENIKPILVSSRVQKEDDIYFLYIGYSAKALSEDVIINKEEHETYEWVNIETFISENPQHILTEQVKRLLGNSM